jgi:hypothetical protein
MKMLDCGRYAPALLSTALLTTFLSACSDRPGNSALPGTNASNPSVSGKKRTFKYTGHEQTFTVPSGVTAIEIVADGASGGSSTGGNGSGSTGANGGRVRATIPVTPCRRIGGLRRRLRPNRRRLQWRRARRHE